MVWAVGTQWMNRRRLPGSVVVLTFWMTALGLVFCAVLALIFERDQWVRWPDPLEWAAVFYNVALVFGVSQLLWFRRATILPPIASSLSVLLIPVVGLFSGMAMLVVSIMTSTLTTRIKKQEQLRMESETEKMRATLLRAVSHDLRTPLTSIYGACSTVIENYDSLEKEQKLKLLGEACSDAQWLNRMVENLLSVTRFDGGQVAVQKTPTVLDELIDTVLVRFQKRYPKVPVTTYLPDSFIVIPMDSMLISQVLTNLLENAAVHAEGMTQLILRVFTLGSRAVFEVSDNGCGIPKERLRTLFTGVLPPVAAADSGKHGMGIGLSVCAAIVKAHGGEIQAESKVGEGTSIRFWLETESIETEENEDEQ